MTEPTPYPLGRLREHDPRSRAFAFAPAAARPIVDVAWKRLVNPYDQGNLGSCTANALCGALSTKPHRHHFNSQRRIVKVYSRATVIDGFDGEYPPDDTGSSGLAVAKVALEKGWIREYRHIFRWDDFLQAMMVGPVITGTVWRSQMFYPEPDGRIRTGGSEVGGHEYEIYGVDTANRRVWLWNSWSASWGIGGRAYMTWDDYRELLADQGDATVLVP